MEEVKLEEISSIDFATDEAFKSLRTNITFCDNNLKVLLITSTTPEEGKTYISLHLAHSYAQAGKKVLFIDADLRRSALTDRYKTNGRIMNLSQFLEGTISMNEIIYQTNFNNLYIVFAGPESASSAELLGGNRFLELLEMQRKQFDYIIIDSPSMGSVIDAAIIGAHSDGAILVVEQNVVSYKLAQRAKKQLEKSGCKILGAVLNKAARDEDDYYNGGLYHGSDKKQN